MSTSDQATSRAFVILNPGAGSIEPSAVIATLTERLGEEPGAFEVHESARGEDLADLARRAADRGVDLVVAAGGDGTVSQVASGLVGTDARLGLIPLGTANVLARELGIPIETEAACRLLAGPNATAEIDALRVGDHHYFTQVGIGVDALMIRDTTASSKRRFGNLAYQWSALRWLVGLQPVRFSISADGESLRTRAAQVLIANCGAIGTSGLRWGPDVRVDDGRADVCVVRAGSVLDFLAVGWSVLRGRHRDQRKLRYFGAERAVAIHADRPLPVQADGEVIGQTPVEVRVVRRAVRVVVPVRPGEP